MHTALGKYMEKNRIFWRSSRSCLGLICACLFMYGCSSQEDVYYDQPFADFSRPSNPVEINSVGIHFAISKNCSLDEISLLNDIAKGSPQQIIVKNANTPEGLNGEALGSDLMVTIGVFEKPTLGTYLVTISAKKRTSEGRVTIFDRVVLIKNEQKLLKSILKEHITAMLKLTKAKHSTLEMFLI